MVDLTQDALLELVNIAEHALELYLDDHEGIIGRHPTAYGECVDTLNAADDAYNRQELTLELVEAFKTKAETFKQLENGHSS